MDSDGLDEMFTALAHDDRRRLLIALLDGDSRGRTVSHLLEEERASLEDERARIEDERDGDADLDHLRIQLYHVHLPKLERAGFVRWEEASDWVERGPRFEEMRPLLELVDS